MFTFIFQPVKGTDHEFYGVSLPLPFSENRCGKIRVGLGWA